MDVIKSALRMRIGAVRPGPGNREWTDALAVFSVAAPLFLLAADILEVALPYRPPHTSLVARMFGSNHQIGGLSLLSQHGFVIAVGGQAVIAALVLLGLRRVALAAITAYAGCWFAVYWTAAGYWIPAPLQLLSASVYLLVAAALIASPGPRRGRHLMTWRHGAVLLVAAAAVQVSTLLYDATSPPVRPGSPDAPGYVVASVVLAVAAAGLAVAWRMNRCFLLLLAAMFYPYVMQLAYPSTGSSSDLIGRPTPGHLALLFAPTVLLACWAVLAAVMPLRSPVRLSFRYPIQHSSGPEKPGPA